MNSVVLDTSVIIAATLNPIGASGRLLDAFYLDRIKLAYTAPVLGEYMEVMARPKFAAFIDDNTRRSLAMKLRASGLVVTPAQVTSVGWPDLDDLPFVAAALATERKVVVTLNRRDFAPALTLGVRVLSPAEAHRELLA